MTLLVDPLIEELARAIYGDSYTQYGTCDLAHWNKTSEVQREFHRSQIRCVLNILATKGLLKSTKIV